MLYHPSGDVALGLILLYTVLSLFEPHTDNHRQGQAGAGRPRRGLCQQAQLQRPIAWFSSGRYLSGKSVVAAQEEGPATVTIYRLAGSVDSLEVPVELETRHLPRTKAFSQLRYGSGEMQGHLPQPDCTFST